MEILLRSILYLQHTDSSPIRDADSRQGRRVKVKPPDQNGGKEQGKNREDDLLSHEEQRDGIESLPPSCDKTLLPAGSFFRRDIFDITTAPASMARVNPSKFRKPVPTPLSEPR